MRRDEVFFSWPCCCWLVAGGSVRLAEGARSGGRHTTGVIGRPLSTPTPVVCAGSLTPAVGVLFCVCVCVMLLNTLMEGTPARHILVPSWMPPEEDANGWMEAPPQLNGTGEDAGTASTGSSQSRSAAGVMNFRREGVDAAGLSHREREERIRQFKQLQLEQTLRRKEELTRQEEQEARQRESADNERRRKIEELRARETERRAQVEDRRRQMEQAEADRRVSMLRRYEERDAMLETKRRHQSSQIVFGFGSCTPRWDPAPNLGKRSSSALNVDSGGGLQQVDGAAVMSQSMHQQRPHTGSRAAAHQSAARLRGDEEWVAGSSRRPRQMDLMPAMPGSSFRDGPPGRTGSAASTVGRSRASPGKAVSMPRLDQLARPRRPLTSVGAVAPPIASGRAAPAVGGSMSRSMSHLAAGADGKGGATSAATGVVPRRTRAERLRLAARQRQQQGASGAATPTTCPSSRPTSALAQQQSATAAPVRMRGSPRRPRPVTIAGIPSAQRSVDGGKTDGSTAAGGAVGGKTPARAQSARRLAPSKSPSSVASAPGGGEHKRPAVSNTASPSGRRTPAQVKADDAKKKERKQQNAKSTSPQPSPLSEDGSSCPAPAPQQLPEDLSLSVESPAGDGTPAEQLTVDETREPSLKADEPDQLQHKAVVEEQLVGTVSVEEQTLGTASTEESGDGKVCELPTETTTSVSAGSTDLGTPGGAERRRAGYSSEQEARAALAEKRRRAREEAERQAEQERIREEQARRDEEERERREEEERIREEEEHARLVEEARLAEEQRLQRAIEDAEQERAAEERRRAEEEAQRKEREEEEARARDEAEKARQEAAIKLQLEEAERKKRRSRVAEIMSRTRGGVANNAADKMGSTAAGDEGGTAGGDTVLPPSVSEMNAANIQLTQQQQEQDVQEKQDEQEKQDVSRLPVSRPDVIPRSPEPPQSSASPMHANGDTNGHGGSSQVTAADPISVTESVSPCPVATAAPVVTRSDSGLHSGEYTGSSMSSLDPISLKSSTMVASSEDSLRSGPLSPTTPLSPELSVTAHTTELLQF